MVWVRFVDRVRSINNYVASVVTGTPGFPVSSLFNDDGSRTTFLGTLPTGTVD